MSNPYATSLRSHPCGQLNKELVGQTVSLCGWVDSRRDHGGLIFVDLRDREGIVQVVLNPSAGTQSAAKDIRNEFVLQVEGVVRARPEGMINKKISTGAVEVEATSVKVLSEAKTLPFAVDDEKVSEVLRLKYRYLEIRSPKLQNILMLRHKTTRLVREFLSENGFAEVETPILYKSTPEGARDYLVPSRVSQGKFYALPQSPQTLKQLLMIGGMERYFQIARCFRDEDLRADRQPEFSQIDIEMSFVDQKDIMDLNERLLRHVWKTVKGKEIGPVPVKTYTEVMNDYGSDKPDLRNPLKLKDVTKEASGHGFKVFDDVAARGGAIKGLAVPKYGSVSRGQIDKLTQMSKDMGAKGMVWMKHDGTTVQSSIQKFFPEDVIQKIFKAAGGETNGAVFIVADDFHVTCTAMSALRNHLGSELDLIDRSQDNFLWVVDFPLLEYDAENKRWAACHHPFTMCKDEHKDKLKGGKDAELKTVYAKAYDLVCNGYEIAGGSIRIHNQEIQEAMFNALGFSEEERKDKFGFFIEALTYGTPPHGGAAWGMDRLVMILAGTDAIRDVIAFPKTAKATDLMSEAPSNVGRDQLLELGIRLATTVDKNADKK